MESTSTPPLRSTLSTIELVVNALNDEPDRPLLKLLDGTTATVGDVRDATSTFAQALAAHGVGEHTRVALLASNLPEVLHATHATQLLGAVYIPMHPLGSLADHQHIVTDAAVDLLIVEGHRYDERAAALLQAAPHLKVVSLGPSRLAADLTADARARVPEPLVCPAWDLQGVERISYSGGTTGRPKSMATRRASSAALWSIMLSEWEWPATPHVLSCAPLSHAGGTMFLPTLLRRGTMLIHPGFDPGAVLSTIQTQRINCMMLVPTMIYALLDHPALDSTDLSSLETVFYGASSISPARLQEALRRIGPVFCQFYGQAEAPMTVSVLRKEDHLIDNLDRLASCGRPVPWLRVELRDINGTVTDGRPGEICVQGPIVMDGYRDDPELDSIAFADGWLHTGDVAVREGDGFLRIVDRTKDMIVSGGFNIYPREIEDTLARHPSVAQSAVIGVPHERWGEAVKALVMLRPGESAVAADLISLVAAEKGSFQAPKSVEFLQEIPTTPVGKIDKKALRLRYR